MGLIESIKHVQGSRTQREFARAIGISESALSMLYAGQRPLGPKIARRLRESHPDLTLVLADALLAKRDDGKAA